jgi:hypothetical protein
VFDSQLIVANVVDGDESKRRTHVISMALPKDQSFTLIYGRSRLIKAV